MSSECPESPPRVRAVVDGGMLYIFEVDGDDSVAQEKWVSSEDYVEWGTDA